MNDDEIKSLEIKITLENGYNKEVLFRVFNDLCESIESDRFCSMASVSTNSSNCVYDGEKMNFVSYNKDARSYSYFFNKPKELVLSNNTVLPPTTKI